MCYQFLILTEINSFCAPTCRHTPQSQFPQKYVLTWFERVCYTVIIMSCCRTFLTHEYSATVPTQHVECFAVSSRVAAYICAMYCRSFSRKRQCRVPRCMVVCMENVCFLVVQKSWMCSEGRATIRNWMKSSRLYRDIIAWRLIVWQCDQEALCRYHERSTFWRFSKTWQPQNDRHRSEIATGVLIASAISNIDNAGRLDVTVKQSRPA